MNKTAKARKHRSPALQALLDEVTPLEMEQAKNKLQLAARIEDLMSAKGWNKKQFAEGVGKTPSEITKWVSGTHNFTLDVLSMIASVLGVELWSLFSPPPKSQIVFRKEIQLKTPAGDWGCRPDTILQRIDKHRISIVSDPLEKSFYSTKYQA